MVSDSSGSGIFRNYVFLSRETIGRLLSTFWNKVFQILVHWKPNALPENVNGVNEETVYDKRKM